MQWIFIYLLAINLLSFTLTGIDKWMATHQKWRVPEKTLHGITLVGGTIGSALGMLLFRHKTAKRSFLLVFFGILVVQFVTLYYFVK